MHLNPIVAKSNEDIQAIVASMRSRGVYQMPIVDPQGIAWEHFHTLDNAPVFGEGSQQSPSSRASVCCGAQGKGADVPAKPAGSACC